MLRQNAGLTQLELADRLKVQEKRISNWELEKWEPSLKNINALCEALGTHASYLLGHSEDVHLPDTSLQLAIVKISERLERIETFIAALQGGKINEKESHSQS